MDMTSLVLPSIMLPLPELTDDEEGSGKRDYAK